jgi:hypothetical protein
MDRMSSPRLNVSVRTESGCVQLFVTVSASGVQGHFERTKVVLIFCYIADFDTLCRFGNSRVHQM